MTTDTKGEFFFMSLDGRTGEKRKDDQTTNPKKKVKFNDDDDDGIDPSAAITLFNIAESSNTCWDVDDDKEVKRTRRGRRNRTIPEDDENFDHLFEDPDKHSRTSLLISLFENSPKDVFDRVFNVEEVPEYTSKLFLESFQNEKTRQARLDECVLLKDILYRVASHPEIIDTFKKKLPHLFEEDKEIISDQDLFQKYAVDDLFKFD